MGCESSTPVAVSANYGGYNQRVVVQGGQYQYAQGQRQLVVHSTTNPSGLSSSAPYPSSQEQPPDARSLPPPMFTSPSPIEKIDIVVAIKKFQELQSVIIALEQKNIISRLADKRRLQKESKEELQTLRAEYQGLETKTKKELADIANLQAIAASPSVSQYLNQLDQQFSKEEEEYIQAKTNQENLYSKIDSLEQSMSLISSQVNDLQKEQNELLTHYEEIDKILESVFGGIYGSSLEDVLEKRFDAVEEKLMRIKRTMINWKNAHKMAHVAVDQLKFACGRWFDAGRIPRTGNYQMLRIHRINEARNYLIAASRNLSATQRNVAPLRLPYCDAAETDTLNTAISYVFVDGLSRERHGHAYHVYRTTLARATMLEKWIDNVISQKITLDLAKAREEYNDCKIKLRMERLRLMKVKLKEETGEDLDIDEGQMIGAALEHEPEVESTAEVSQPEKIEDSSKDEEVEKAKAENKEEIPDELKQEEAKPSLEELAPPPSKNELFGDLDSIMEEYNEQQKALEKDQEINKARQDANLQEKLRRRRSRKMRMEAQGVQLVPENGPE